MRATDLIRISSRKVWRQYRKNIGVVTAIIVGTAGLMVIMTMGKSIEENISNDLEIIGNATRLRVVFQRLPTERSQIDNREFKQETIEGIRKIPGIYKVSAAVFKQAPVELIHEDNISHYPMIGVDDSIWDVNGSYAQRGLLFDKDDLDQHRPVCVLGQRTANELFGSTEIVGRFISADHNILEIIGVLDNLSIPDKRRFIIVPLTTAQDRFDSISPVNRLYVRCDSWDDINNVTAAIPEVVREFQPDDEVEILFTKEILDRVKTIHFGIRIFVQLALVATFILGGVGIWNIMMMAVRSRTREIGLKKAIGAEDHDILFQFLAESLILCFSATTIGFFLGLAGVNLTASILKSAPPQDLFLLSTFISFSFSVVLGLGAGLAPAIKASRMEVVTALRYE